MRKERFVAKVGPLIAKEHHVIERSAEAALRESPRSPRRRRGPRRQKTPPSLMKGRQSRAVGFAVEIPSDDRGRHGLGAFPGSERREKRLNLCFTQGAPLAKVGEVHIHQTDQARWRSESQDLGAPILILLAVGKGQNLQRPCTGEGGHDHQPRSRGKELSCRLQLPEFRASRRHVRPVGRQRRFKMPNRTPFFALGVEHFLKATDRPRPTGQRLAKMMHAAPVGAVAFPRIQSKQTDCHADHLTRHAEFWRETLAVSDDSTPTKKENLRES